MTNKKQEQQRYSIHLRLTEQNERFLRIAAIDQRATVSQVINKILDDYREEAK